MAGWTEMGHRVRHLFPSKYVNLDPYHKFPYMGLWNALLISRERAPLPPATTPFIQKFKIGKTIETESQLVVARGGEMGKD